MSRKRSLLAITAHPDDESGAFGATLALYARRGVAVEIVCATCGEAGRHRGAAGTREELCRLRREEFARACSFLGASWHRILNYPDGGLRQVPFSELGLDLCRVIRERKPDIVITFGPEGGYTGHADHSAIAQHATFAFHTAGRDGVFPDAGPPHKPARLYWVTGPEPLPDYPSVTFAPITAEIDVTETFGLKVEAFEHHTTQEPLFERFRVASERFGPREYFHLAASLDPRPVSVQSDLFEGM